jgi:hypothetical protein
MGVAELLSLLQEFDNPLQHPVIGLVFSAVYNEIKAQKSKKKKEKNVAYSSFFFCFVMRERRQIGLQRSS